MNQKLALIVGLLLLMVTGGCAGRGSFGEPEPVEGALVGQIYFLPENTERLPDFSQLTPVGTIHTATLDIPTRNFYEGFPSISKRTEWFGLNYTGLLRIRTPGVYTLKLTSDDGSRLYLGNDLVIDNDFQHNTLTKSARIRLDAGDHPLTVAYFQGPRHEIALQLFITPPGQPEQIFDSTLTY